MRNNDIGTYWSYSDEEDVLWYGETDFLDRATDNMDIHVMGCNSGVCAYYQGDKMIGIKMRDAGFTALKMWCDIVEAGGITHEIDTGVQVWMVTREFMQLKIRVFPKSDNEYTAVSLDYGIKVEGGKSRADAIGMLLLGMGNAFLEDIKLGRDPFQRKPASDDDWYGGGDEG